MTEAAPNVQPTANTIAIKAPDGSLYEVPKGDLSQLPEGASIATQEDVSQARAESKYGGLKGEAAAAGLGALRGLTFGGSDILATGLAESVGGKESRKSVAEALRGYEEANPNATTAGEVGSFLVPALGELGAASKIGKAAEAASVLQRGVFGAGRAAENLAGNVLGREAESLGARTLQSAARSAVGGAVEGAAFGAGNELSDAAINDHELTAEKLWASAGKGALLGAGLAGGLGAASEIGSTVVKGIGSYAAKKLEGSSLSDILERQSREAAFRSARAGKAVARSAERFADEGFAGVGKIWRDEAPELVGKTSFAKMTREDLREAADKGIEREGEKLGSILDKVDAHASQMPRAIDIINEAKAIETRLEARALSGPARAKLRDFQSDVARISGITDEAGNILPELANKPISFRQFRDFRKDADNIAYGSKLNPDLSGYKGDFAELRDKLEQKLTTSLDEASTSLGEKGLRREYEDAKKKYQAFSWLQKASENEGAAAGANLGVTLTQKLASSAGGIVGSVLGGPIGFAVGAGVGGAGAKLAREHGEFVASDVLNKLGTLAAAERISMHVDSKIAQGVQDFFHGARAESAKKAFTREDAKSLMRQAQDIQTVAQNPDALSARIERSIGNLGANAPNVTRALAMKAANDYAFLASKAPPVHRNVNSLTPQFERVRFSDNQARVFGKYLKGVEDPMSILSDMKRGTLSREKVEAVKITSPKLYDQVRTQVVEQCNELGDKIPYEKKLQLGILFQAPTDETLTPEFIQSMQATVAPASPEKPESYPPKQGGGRRPIKLNAAELQTSSEQIASEQD